MNICCKILLILLLEIVFNIIFISITPKDENKAKTDWRSILKGLLERFFLTYSLINGLPHALTLFGALKLGTRLKSADNEKTEEGRRRERQYNDYYLTGNFISVILAIFYYSLLVPNK